MTHRFHIGLSFIQQSKRSIVYAIMPHMTYVIEIVQYIIVKYVRIYSNIVAKTITQSTQTSFIS